MEDVATEESAFVQEDVLAVIKEVRCRCSRGGRHTVLRANFFYSVLCVRVQAVDQVLGNSVYSHTKVKQWTSMVRAARTLLHLSRFETRTNAHRILPALMLPAVH